MSKRKEEKTKYMKCGQCGKRDETVSNRPCGYTEEIYGNIVMETICDACEHEHLEDVEMKEVTPENYGHNMMAIVTNLEKSRIRSALSDKGINLE